MTAKELKNALLQEAVQGKLVPQISSEGNARDLLEEIRKEKLSHGLDFANAKSGKRKSKKETALAGSNPCDITEDEIPFEIPENWCWCRLGEVFETTSGTTPQSKNPIYYNNGTIGWVRTTDLNNGILSFAEIKITEKAKSDCNLKIIPKNSVCIALYGGAGTIGKNAILNFETTINQSVCAILPTKFADMRYLQYFLKWQRPYWMDYASGSRKDPNINQIIVKNCPFPLPPLSEQKRIVAAIEKFMPLIEEYGKKETELKAINEKIGTLTKKAILQEAVQGKLVPQIASEGNARDLLEEIRKERLSHGLDFANAKSGKKKSKKETALAGSNPCDIKEEEIPFEIPESWCWCRLGDVITFINGRAYSKEELLDKGKYRVLRVGNFFTNDSWYYSNLELESEKYCDNGDLLYAWSASFGPRIWSEDKVIFHYHIWKLDFSERILYKKYLYYFLLQDVNKIRKSTTGSTMVHVSMTNMIPRLIPIPPLAEQKRIVAAIEKMLPLCEKLGG